MPHARSGILHALACWRLGASQLATAGAQWSPLSAELRAQLGEGGPSGTASLGLANQDVGRRLSEIITTLPEDITVRIGDLPAVSADQHLDVVAGVEYSSGVQLLAAVNFAASLDGVARLRVVLDGTPTEEGGCNLPRYYSPGGVGFVDEAITLEVDQTNATSAGAVSFMLGGYYRLCYSHDGTFADQSSSQIAPAPQSLRIRGAALDCATDRCFEVYEWLCFAYRDETSPAGSCLVRFDNVEHVTDYPSTRLSWGSTLTGLSAQDVDDLARASCGEVPSEKVLAGYKAPHSGTLGREFALQASGLPPSDAAGFSVQLCYCPNYDGDDASSVPCDSDTDFVQRVGRALFFLTRACDDSLCSNEFFVLSADAPFLLRLECAGIEACSASSGNRVKIIDENPLGANDQSSWQEDAGCRVFAQSSNHLLPTNCEDGAVATCGGPLGEFHGGVREDYKAFDGIVLGPHYVAGVAMPRAYDVCYCDDNCDASSDADAASRFYKVGRLTVAPMELVRTTEFGTDTGVSIVGVVGDIMVNGQTNVPTVPRPAQIKLLWDNLREKTSDSCEGLVDAVIFEPGRGPSCQNENLCDYTASAVPTNAPFGFVGTGSVITFNDGGQQSQRVTFDLAGVVAVCYCGVLADGTGSQPLGECFSGDDGSTSYWTLMTRMLIRGPCELSALGHCLEEEWTFFTGVTFKIDMHGVGLRSTDKLRIVPPDSSCRDAPDGSGTPDVLKGCPENCHPMSLPNDAQLGGGVGYDDVDLHTLGHNTVGCDNQWQNCNTVQVVELMTYSDHTLWRFDGYPLLDEGDSVVLDDVTGSSLEENALMAGSYGLEHLGWTVSLHVDPYKVRVGAHLLTGMPPHFTSGGGWHRHNRASTREELRATAPGQQLQVCWGTDFDAYHATAGQITFIDPDSMGSASVRLTGLEAGRSAPVVIAFETQSAGAPALTYKEATNSMQLKLGFLDTTKLEPMSTSANSAALPATALADYDEPREAQQFICGTFILELWSEDDKGFPLPRGCYYTSLYGSWREFGLVFEPHSGLEAGRKYQLVLNARTALDATPDDQVLYIWSMDEIDLSPYGVVERGDARVSQQPLAAAGAGQPRFASSGGLTLLDEAGGFSDLLQLTSDPGDLLFRLQGDGESRITAGSMLRIFLRPLTAWDLGPECLAECFPHRTRVCGAITTCAGDHLVHGLGRRVVIRLQLPSDMTDIYGSTSQHTVRVSQLALPRLGFFGTRVGAQVSTEFDDHVHYTESAGVYLWKKPSTIIGGTVAHVVSMAGDGNDKPYRGDTGNTLYVRFLLGASLRAELSDGDASFTLSLPFGYTCRAAADAPPSLSIFEGVSPQGRGSLHAGQGAGSWLFNREACEYRLRANELLPAGTFIYVRLTVDNPEAPIQQSDVLNRWYIGFESKGWYRKAAQVVEPVAFVDGPDISVLGANLPVIGKLTYANLQPATFKAGATDNAMQVFFRVEQPSGANGVVLLVAPIGFNFATILPDLCQLQELAAIYYRDVGSGMTTRYLPLVETCITDCSVVGLCPLSTFNRANIIVQSSLEASSVYGFSIRLQNKAGYEAGDDEAWSLSTVDSAGFGLDAAVPTVRFNPASGSSDGAWAVYQDAGSVLLLNFQFSSLLPYAVTEAWASMTVSYLKVPAPFTATCRLVIADGYEVTPEGFIYHASSFVGATSNWPGGLPWQSEVLNRGSSNVHGDQPKNVLLWDAAAYLSNENYGFVALVKIPEHPVSTTTSSLFLQFGWDATSLAERPLVYVLPLPRIRSVVNFAVSYTTNVAAAISTITVALDTVTPIPVGGMVRVQAPADFVFDERCIPTAVVGEEPLPEILDCAAHPQMSQGGSSLGTMITLVPLLSEIAPGRFAFSLRATNPREARGNRGGQQTPCGYEVCWAVEVMDERGIYTDMSGHTPAFEVNTLMVAKLVELNNDQRVATGRSDRPGSPNNLIFAFTLTRRPSSVGELILAGPRGYTFDDNCLPGLRIADTGDSDEKVFGSLDWLLGYSKWETSAHIRSCTGTGSSAVFYVELGLRANRMYVFRIAVASNPTETPVPNQWTIQYSAESSRPFEGFTLWMFTDISLTPTSTSASSDTSMVPNPVTLQFRPYKEVRGDPLGQGAGGMLRITAPSGFVAVTDGGVAQRCAEYTLTQGDEAFTPGADVSCAVSTVNSNILDFGFIGDKKLEAGKSYRLIAQYYNPRSVTSVEMEWAVETFQDTSGSFDAALDWTSFPGFGISAPLYRWVVTPPAGDQHASASVDDVKIEMAFASVLQQGDEIVIYSPAGFDLSAQRTCSPQFGHVQGGERFDVGFSSSLDACAEKIWDVVPEATAAAWNTLDERCIGYKNENSLNICGPVTTTTSTMANSAAPLGSDEVYCEGFVHHVCAFAGLDRGCRDFAWLGEAYVSGEPTCTMNAMIFRLLGGDYIEATSIVSFVVTTRNPGVQPALIDNFWVVEQYAAGGVPKYSSAVPGWVVIPVLEDATVRLAGASQASGSVSSLTLSFTPVSDADEIEMEALAPPGFDFSNFSLASGSPCSVARRSETSITLACAIRGGEPVGPLVLHQVRLALPGPSRFRIATAYLGIKVDEILEVADAATFIVPGRIDVTQQKLETSYAMETYSYNYRAEFQPRRTDVAVATFKLRFGIDVSVGDTFSMTALPFTFIAGGLMQLMALDGQGVEYSITTGYTVVDDGAGVNLTFSEVVLANVEVTLRSEVIAGPEDDNGERWHMQTVSTDGHVRNTNDKYTDSFLLVRIATLKLNIGRVAPQALVDLELLIDCDDTLPDLLLLYGPTGYSYPQGTCLNEEQSSQSQILSCRPIDEANIAELRLAGAGLQGMANAMLQVYAPDNQEDVLENVWLVQALSQGREVAWGDADGFEVVQLKSVRLIYGGAPAVKTAVAMIFTTDQLIPNGARIEVTTPEFYKLSCRDTEGYNTLSLPPVSACDDSGIGLRLTVNGTILPGEYAFMYGQSNPAYTPAVNLFSLLLKDVDSNVVDARTDFEGDRIVSGLYVRPPLLGFSASGAIEETDIQISFVVFEDLDPEEAIGAVRALQVAAPEHYVLQTGTPVQNLDGITTPESGWYHFYYIQRLVRIDLVADASSLPRIIPEGTYRFVFRVQNPEFWPRVNIWLLSLCRDVACTDLIATLPVAGFDAGDEPTLISSGDGDQSLGGGSALVHGSLATSVRLLCFAAVGLAIAMPHAE